MLNDLRIGARTFLRNPGFASLAVITLALGIAANTAMFSVVNGVLLRPLPFPDPDRVVVVNTPTAARADNSHSAPDFIDLVREQQSFTALAGVRQDLFAVVSPNGQAQQFQGAHVTSAFFDVFGLPAEAGRPFTAAADTNVGGARVVFSHAAATQLTDDVSSLVNSTLKVNGVSTLVVGIMPPLFNVPEGTGVWMLSAGQVPPSPLGGATSDRDLRYFDVVARVRADWPAAQIQGDLNRVAELLNAQRTAEAETRRLSITPLHDDLVGDVRAAILVLQIGVGVVLLIACVNISSLLIARTTGRQRELAVRAAMGAGAGRLIRQLMSESLILGGVGGALGLLLGQWAVSALVRLLPSNLPLTGDIAIDGTVAVATLLVAMFASVVFGALPALQASRTRAAMVLRESDGRTMTSRSKSRSALVVLEIALTLVLLVAAGLLSSTLARLQQVESGFDVDQVTVGSFGIPQTRYPDSAAQIAFYRRLTEALDTRPEFASAAIGFPAPLAGQNASGSFTVVGQSTPQGGERPFGHVNSVSPGFFKTMGIPVLAGRAFEAGDLGQNRVAIISQTAARRYWPDTDPVGRQIRFDSENAPFTIVGVTGDVRQLGLREDPPVLVYFPYTQFPLPFMTLAVRSPQSNAAVTAAMRDVLQKVDADLPLPTVQALADRIDGSLADARFRTFVFGVLALVALALAAVGVYGLVSYSVSQQTREIGIRVALGASPRQILRTIVIGGALLALTGVGVGLVGAWFAVRSLASFLFGVGVTEPTVFISVSLVLLAVALLASYLPARRALRVDPMTALRSE